MMDSIINFLKSPWFTGVASGTIVALSNYFLTRNKTKVEIKKLEAECEKIRLEAEKLRQEMNIGVENIASLGYQSSTNSERILYNSSQRNDIGFDFKGTQGKIYKKNEQGIDVPITNRGLGNLRFDRNIINLERTNTEGRFEILLTTYLYESVEKQFLPKDDYIEGRKRFKISFEVKVTSGKHTLKFVFKGMETQKWLGQGEKTFSETEWTPATLYINAESTENCRLRIDDQEVSNIPSSIQIRNFILAEKIS